MAVDEKHTIPGMVLRYMPDFCWQDINEIITMLEYVYLDINVGTVKKVVCDLYKDGKLLVKISPYVHTGPKGKAFLYMKNKEYR
jgi:hypothetical protein